MDNDKCHTMAGIVDRIIRVFHQIEEWSRWAIDLVPVPQRCFPVCGTFLAVACDVAFFARAGDQMASSAWMPACKPRRTPDQN